MENYTETSVHKQMKFPEPSHAKVVNALVDHVYSQTYVAMLTAMLCASVIFFTLLHYENNSPALTAWYATFLTVMISRMVVAFIYTKKVKSYNPPNFWRNILISAALMSGLCWGASGVFLLPYVPQTQQILLTFMIGGITAGSVPLMAAIPAAEACFLSAALLPYIMSITQIEIGFNMSFVVVLFFYYVYLNIISYKTYQIIKQSIVLTFENDDLVANLSQAKAQLEVINRRLLDTASHDPLTQLANRTMFHHRLREAISEARNLGKTIALLYIDLDSFKPVNDQFGHHVGDQVLRIVANRLINIFGRNDNIARLGGDEFAVLYENIKNLEELETIAKAVCDSLNEPIQVFKIKCQVGASIGISLFPLQAVTIDDLIHYADLAMYKAKQQGGGSYCFYEAVETTV